jgi:hypothetical protein
MTPDERMQRIDTFVSHMWMVRTFLKHSEEAEEDEELCEVHRVLYDFMLSLGESWAAQDAESYLRIANKKLAKLRQAVELFEEIQSDVSAHMNFKMARTSLRAAFDEIESLITSDSKTL